MLTHYRIIINNLTQLFIQKINKFLRTQLINKEIFRLSTKEEDINIKASIPNQHSAIILIQHNPIIHMMFNKFTKDLTVKQSKNTLE